ncbi:MAG: GNAT family N-acetyltransferase [Alphaproteobacteria bacterium]
MKRSTTATPQQLALATTGDGTATLAFSVLQGPQELAALQADWAALYGGCPDRRFCLCPDWGARMWARAAARLGRRPLVIVGRDAEGCRLVWPLVVYRQRLWRVVQPMSEDLSDFDDILVAAHPDADRWRSDAWALMLRTVRPDMVVCRRVPAGSGLDRLLGEAAGAWQRESASPYVDFRRFDGWDGYYRSLSRKTRSTNRNRRNRLERFGPLAFVEVSEPAAAEALIGWMFREKHRRLGARAHSRQEKTTHAQFGADLPFLQDAATTAFRGGQMRLFRLSAGAATVAVMSGLVAERRLIGWLYAYDPAFLSGGPGRVLLLESLRWAQQAGFDTVDFMPDPEPYKAEWTDKAYGVRDVRLATSAWGRVLVTWYRSPLRGLLIALYMRLPRPMQAVIRRAA